MKTINGTEDQAAFLIWDFWKRVANLTFLSSLVPACIHDHWRCWGDDLWIWEYTAILGPDEASKLYWSRGECPTTVIKQNIQNYKRPCTHIIELMYMIIRFI